MCMYECVASGENVAPAGICVEGRAGAAHLLLRRDDRG